jgi:hypothetical protein
VALVRRDGAQRAVEFDAGDRIAASVPAVIWTAEGIAELRRWIT